MAVMCKFGNMTFNVSPSKLNPISDFSTSIKQVADNNSSAENKPITNGRGTDLREWNFSCHYVAGLGIDIESEISKWESLVTKYEYIYLNNKKVTPLVQLREVSISKCVLNDKGRYIEVTLNFKFKEYDKKTTSVIGTSAFGTSKQTIQPAVKQEVAATSKTIAKATTKTITKGCYVKPTGKKYATGQTIPSWVKNQYHQVYQIKSDRILLGYPKGICSWIFKNECVIK